MHILETTPKTNNKLDADFSIVRPAAWSIGKNVSGLSTSAQCIKKSKLDYTVEKTPVIVNIQGQPITSKDQYATIRTDKTGEDAILGFVKEKYEILQNVDAFEFLDGLAGDNFAMYSKAGSFRNGARIFIQCELPEHLTIEAAPGDKLRPLLLVTNGHNGKHALNICFTYVRIWCENTLNMALKNAVGNVITLRHCSNMTEKLKTTNQILKISDQYQEELSALLPALSGNEISEVEWTAIVGSAFATKDVNLAAYLQGEREDTKLVSSKLVNSIDAVKMYDNLNPTQKGLGRTAWGAYNAVTGYFQNVEKTDSFDNGDKLNSIIEGRIAAAGQKAWDTAVSIAEGEKLKFIPQNDFNFYLN